MTIAKANSVLIHELVHAAQSESYGRNWGRVYKRERHKWEANARRIAWLLIERKLVTV